MNHWLAEPLLIRLVNRLLRPFGRSVLASSQASYLMNVRLVITILYMSLTRRLNGEVLY